MNRDLSFWKEKPKGIVSHDLAFWKEKPGIRLNPARTYEQLLVGERLEGLEELPVEQMLQRVRLQFHDGWTQLDPQTWQAPGKGFQIHASPQLLHVDCAGMSGDEQNAFIDLALEFGRPLYEPSDGRRYLKP